MIVVRVCVVMTGIGRAHTSRHMLTHHADVPATLAARRRGCRLPMHVVFLFLHVKTLFLMSSFRAFGLKIGAGSGSTKTFRRSAWLQVMAFLLGLSPQLAKTQLAIETIVNYYCSLLSNKLLF